MPLKLAGLLVTCGTVPSNLLDDALRRQVLAGGSIDTALLECGAPLSEEAYVRAIEQTSGLPAVEAAQLLEVDPRAARLVPAKLAERHCLLPLKEDGRTLHVAVAYPPNVQMLEEIGFLLGRDLNPFVAVEARLREAIARVYGLPMPARHAALVALLGPVHAEPEGAPVHSGQVEADEPPAASSEPAAQSPRSAADARAEPGSPPSASSEPTAAVAADEEIQFDTVDEGGAAAATTPPEPAEPAKPADKRDGSPVALTRDEPDGLASAIERVLAAVEADPRVLQTRPHRKAPRDRVDVAGIASRIVAVSGGTPALDGQPVQTWTLGKARRELDRAEDRHQIIDVALRFALKTFDFVASFAVVGGNAVGWTAVTPKGRSDELVERISLPLDAPSVLRTVLMTRGRYLGPIPSDPLSQSLIAQMGRSEPKAAFLYPVEVRDRPVVILYGDAVGRPVSDRRVAELVLFAQRLGPRFERLIIEQKRRLAAAAAEPAAREPKPKPEGGQAIEGPAFSMQPPALTAAELFAQSPVRRRARKPASSYGPLLSSPVHAAPAPGVSRVAAARASDFGTQLPSMDELFGAADRLVGTDLNERAKALGALCRLPEVAAAVLVARFPGPVLRARVTVAELPAPEELGPVPAALAKMGAPAARALAPLLEHRDLDTRYFALLTAARLAAPALVAPVAQRVFDAHPVIASAARAALAAMATVPGFEEARQAVREGLSREPETASAAARALGRLHDVGAIEQLIELTGTSQKTVAQAAAEALREICKQALGPNPAMWGAWWRTHREKPRAEWLIDALSHRDLDVRVSAIDELVRTYGDNLGFYADAPGLEREMAIGRWHQWWQRAEANPANGGAAARAG